MSFPCKFCGRTIYSSTDDKKRYFEDEGGTIFHNCPMLKKNHNDDHKLLTSTVTRVSKVERAIEQHKGILENNGINFDWEKF